MENRKYNIFFNLHTVSGIVISVVLFVIFFAGSFSFFRDEINVWQTGKSAENSNYLTDIDWDNALKMLDSGYVMRGRTVEFSRPHAERQFIAHMDPTVDSLADKRGRIHEYFYIDTKTLKTETYDEGYRLGEFIYRLHFLAQIPYPYGYYLAGFTALFFLFAIITGVLVHWKKIVSNFYVFRPKEKLKTLWTDAHTALGMIGLPFQFVYALTGAFFLINIFLVAPTVALLYNSDQEKFYQDLEFVEKSVPYENTPLTKPFSVGEIVKKAEASFNDARITGVAVVNYGDTSMRVSVTAMAPTSDKLTSIGKYVYCVADDEVIFKRDPRSAASYFETTKNLLYKLHYGDYAGYALKAISFVLGIITCLVILSGVMIWLTARDKKNVPEKKRKFNFAVARIYMAISLSMFPITALVFPYVKFRPESGQGEISLFYFGGWLLLSILFFFVKDLKQMTRVSLLSGAIIGLLVPVCNGCFGGSWFWQSFHTNNSFFVVDVMWLIIGLISLASVFAMNGKSEKTA